MKPSALLPQKAKAATQDAPLSDEMPFGDGRNKLMLSDLVGKKWDNDLIFIATLEIQELSLSGHYNTARAWSNLLHRNLERLADEANKGNGNGIN